MRTWLVTGGAGFIGSEFVRIHRQSSTAKIVNLDLLTYAGNPDNLASLKDDPDHIFVHGDIRDVELVRNLLETHKPQAVLNFAAESHVDRSISGGAADFLETNIRGTLNLLEQSLHFWSGLEERDRQAFRFVHVSTDEVYGSLGPEDPAFTEATAYAPNSPYAASKAASDHLVRAWHQTYGLPTLTTHASNNYGPYQYPEKLIPLMILRALEGAPLPIYGDGQNVRDWLYVRDHCKALAKIHEAGQPGGVYNVGGGCEKTNTEVVHTLCRLLDEIRPDPLGPYERLTQFVKDRLGHDRRYAIDSTRMEREIGWTAQQTFEAGLRETIEWYLENTEWVKRVQSGTYREWIVRHYGDAAPAEAAK